MTELLQKPSACPKLSRELSESMATTTHRLAVIDCDQQAAVIDCDQAKAMRR